MKVQDRAETRIGRTVAIRLARVAGWVLLFLAVAALGYEVLLATVGGTRRVIAAGELWYALDPGSLNFAQAITQRYLHPALWDPILQSVLTWPAWSLLSAPGIALVVALSGRRSRDEHQEEARLGAA
jgi:glycosyltransferase involved in cell wall biosynthesis